MAARRAPVKSGISVAAPAPSLARLFNAGLARRRGLGRRLSLEMGVMHHVADLDVVGGITFLPAQSLRRQVLGMHPPAALGLLGLELDDGHALAVLGPKSLVRDVARHLGYDFAHALDQRHVLVL